MRIKYAIIIGCAVVFTASYCCAAGLKSEPVEHSTPQRISAPSNLDSQQLKPWLNSIRPAAGISKQKSIVQRKEYWQQTVN